MQEQTLTAEETKLKLGASTVFNVIQVERDLANARSAEVAALDTYAMARVELDRSTGQTLTNHNISMSEAFRGRVSAPPSALPAGVPEGPLSPIVAMQILPNDAYLKAAESTIELRFKQAGVRLAYILNQIWPHDAATAHSVLHSSN